jgi:hypothetical protein
MISDLYKTVYEYKIFITSMDGEKTSIIIETETRNKLRKIGRKIKHTTN